VLGDNHRLRARLSENGKRADAEVLEAKERPWATRKPGEIGAYGTFRLKLQVSPVGEPAFTAEITDQWRATGEPRVGMRVPVLYDPGHHSKLVLDKNPGKYSLIEYGGPKLSLDDDPDLAMLREFERAEAPAAPAPADPAQARLDRLTQIADLRDRGVLSDEEFAAEKAKILSDT
jgi:putative oligomerization/nucleic acid binding protein